MDQPTQVLQLVLARRRTEDDPLDLVGRAATEAKRCLQALAPELTGVQRAPQLIQRGVILLANVLVRGLEQDQMAWTLERSRHAYERLTIGGLQTVDGKHHGLPALQALGNGGAQELLRADGQILLGHA